jgi:hypothetical protein
VFPLLSVICIGYFAVFDIRLFVALPFKVAFGCKFT